MASFLSSAYVCFWEIFNHFNLIVPCPKKLPATLVTRCIMGWPELPCCGVFCNCDEGVTQMLNWTLMCKYCFRWTLCRMIRHISPLRLYSYTHTHVCTHAHSHAEMYFQESPHLHVGNFLVRFHTHLSLFPLLSQSLPPSLSLFVSLSSTLHPHLRTEGGGPHQSRGLQRAGFSGTDVWLSCWFNLCS